MAHDLSAAFANLENSYKVAQSNYNRRMAAKQQLKALEAVYDDADESEKTRLLDLLLDAQRRLADAEVEYFRVVANYANAIKQVHLEKGSLLDYNEVFLSEGAWPAHAYHDAARRESLRGRWRLDAFVHAKPGIVSQGTYSQQTGKGNQPGDVAKPNIEAFAPPVPVIDKTPVPIIDRTPEAANDRAGVRTTLPRSKRLTQPRRVRTISQKRVRPAPIITP